MDHAGCVLWPLSKLLGRRFFKVMSDRCLVTCILHDHVVGVNYLISRILVANILPSDGRKETVHHAKPWWLSSDDLPRGEAEVMFIPGDVIDSADGECSGAMYELSSQSLYRTDLFDFWTKVLADQVNAGHVSISYSVATTDDEDGKTAKKIVKSMREVYDCVVLSLIHMWRLSHQITLANPSLRRIFDVKIPSSLMDSLAEYHTLLARGNNSFPKIVPLTYSEATRPYDITLKFWRECELLQISTDLCYMYLGTGMPLMSVVCPIYGMNEHMYRNINMTRKYRLAEKYTGDIYEARRIIETTDASHIPQDILDKASRNPDDYTVLDIAGMIIMPYSGQSVAHVLSGARGSIIQDSFLWSMRERLITPDVFKQLYMNWLITLYNLHFAGGIIHGDLHAGNVTMYTNYTGYEQKYIIPGPNETVSVYIQRSAEPYIGRIIDFSRSFITGKGPLRNRHSTVALKTVLEDQRNRFLVSISRAIPDIYKTLAERIAEIVDGDDWEYLGIIDEVYLSRALLEIFKGLRDGRLDSRFVSSKVFDATFDDDAKKKSDSGVKKDNVPKMDISSEITSCLEAFIAKAEEYIIKKVRGIDDGVEYPTIGFLKESGFFDGMKCTTMPLDKIDGLKIGDDADKMTASNGACSSNGGNRCISSLVSFGSTIRDDIYMALIDAGDKFPKADKNKIRIMLDIHDRNDEWYSLADNIINDSRR